MNQPMPQGNPQPGVMSHPQMTPAIQQAIARRQGGQLPMVLPRNGQPGNPGQPAGSPAMPGQPPQPQPGQAQPMSPQTGAQSPDELVIKVLAAKLASLM